MSNHKSTGTTPEAHRRRPWSGPAQHADVERELARDLSRPITLGI